MTGNRSVHLLKSINGFFDETGEILGCYESSRPIKDWRCIWPLFLVLPPPMSTNANKRTQSLGGVAFNG